MTPNSTDAQRRRKCDDELRAAAIRVDGLDGLVIAAQGQLEATPVRLYQVTLFTEDRAYVLVGRSSAERWNWYRAAFEKMARSFRRVPR